MARDCVMVALNIIILVLFLGLFPIVESGIFRQTIFVNGPCAKETFLCSNNKCIERRFFCDGINNCGDGSDEIYCNGYNYKHECPETRPLKKPGYAKCLPLEWKCDGIRDYEDGWDEINCFHPSTGEETVDVAKAKLLGEAWITTLRKNGTRQKWGSDVHRIAVALYLANPKSFIENSEYFNEIAYEITTNLLSRMALRKIEDFSTTELAFYVNAFLVSCIDPRKFYVLDLVKELRDRVNARNYTNPFVMLALCNAGDKITDDDIEKLTQTFWATHRELWTDTQALSILALSCAASQPGSTFDAGKIKKMSLELKSRQSRNGEVENLKTTALVLQALFASDEEDDDENFDEGRALKQILRAQQLDGSFGNMVNTYYVLPLLNYRSLVNISSSHCNITSKNEKEGLRYLQNQVGPKHHVQYSLWVGDDKDFQRTINLRVPLNTSFYGVMEMAADIDSKFRFEHTMKNGKPYIYAISRIQDDPESGKFWFLYTADNEPGSDLTLFNKSPAEAVPHDKQHFIFWYKLGSWA